MAIQKVVTFKSGARLMLFKRGKSKYIPSEKYLNYRELMDEKRRMFRKIRPMSPERTSDNCDLLFDRIISYMALKSEDSGNEQVIN